MKRSRVLKMTVLIFSLFCVSLFAQGIEFAEATTITAEVYGVEKIDRDLWLQGPEGNVIEMQVGEQARNFNQLEIGDMVNITFYQSVAIFLGKPGELPKDETGTVVVRAPEGSEPGGMAVEVTDISASVVSIDKENRILTLKGPLGNTLTTYVDESNSYFDELKVGDTINVRYTKALAIDVEVQD
jgi:hypothetical protein